MLLDEGFDILLGYVAGRRDDVCARDLGPGDSDADDGCVEDLGVREEQGFQFGGGDSVLYVSVSLLGKSPGRVRELGSRGVWGWRGVDGGMDGWMDGVHVRTGGLCIL